MKNKTTRITKNNVENENKNSLSFFCSHNNNHISSLSFLLFPNTYTHSLFFSQQWPRVPATTTNHKSQIIPPPAHLLLLLLQHVSSLLLSPHFYHSLPPLLSPHLLYLPQTKNNHPGGPLLLPPFCSIEPLIREVALFPLLPPTHPPHPHVPSPPFRWESFF